MATKWDAVRSLLQLSVKHNAHESIPRCNCSSLAPAAMRSAQETLGLRKAGGAPRWLRARLLSWGLTLPGGGDNPGRPIPQTRGAGEWPAEGKGGTRSGKWRETASKNQTDFRFSRSEEGKQLTNRSYCYFDFFFCLVLLWALGSQEVQVTFALVVNRGKKKQQS